MPTQPKPKKVGRPKLPKGETKGGFIAVRFNADDLKKIADTAKSKKPTISEWVRSTLTAAIGG